MGDIEHSTLTGSELHTPKTHETSHENGGSDELDFDQLAEGTTYKKFLATERTRLTVAFLKDGSEDMTDNLNMAGHRMYLNETNNNYITEVGSDIVNYVNNTYNIVFGTTEITSHMPIRPISTNTKDLGTATFKWKDVYATTLHGSLTAAEITSGTLPVARGGTGVTGDTYDADKVDGCDAGTSPGNVFKLPSVINQGCVMFFGNSNALQTLESSTDGYQLTTHGSSADPTWAAASDLIWSDTHCYICGEKFEDDEELALQIRKHNEVGDILTVPVHIKCTDVYKALENRITNLEA